MHSPITPASTRRRDEDISVPHDITEEVYTQPQSKAEADKMQVSTMESSTTFPANELNSTALDRKNSPFLRLSGELRNQIYEYALCQDWTMKSDALSSSNNGSGTQNLPFKDLQRSLQTTGICKQMHTEMALLPFGFGTFVINDCPYAFINQWLLHRSLPQQQAITRIVFPCTYELSFSGTKGWMRGNFGGAGFRPRHATNLKLSIVLPGLRDITLSIDVATPDEQHTYLIYGSSLSLVQVQEWAAYDIEILKEACVDALVTTRFQFCPALQKLL